MNFYIDFDHTLYNTKTLKEKMLNSIVNSIKEQKNLDEDSLLEECKSMYNRENIYDIYELIQYFAQKYDLEALPIINNLNNQLLNCQDLVFEDSIRFLKKLKSAGHKIILFSYQPFGAQFSILKIAGSHLLDYVDAEYISAFPKSELEINYTNGIFIDDNPKDLLALYSKNPKAVIRLRRKDDTYSSIDIENADIKEYENFDEIPIDLYN